MILDDINISEGGEGSLGSSEKVHEINEKQREKSKKAQGELQKTQKDEKKAYIDDQEIFTLLLRFIQNPLYDELISSITLLLQKGCPSRFLLALIAFFYPEGVEYLSKKTSAHHAIEVFLALHTYKEREFFDEKTIDHSIRDWVSLWITLVSEYLSDPQSSVVIRQKILTFEASKEQKILLQDVMIGFFHFFFDRRNITIKNTTLQLYVESIMSTIFSSIRSSFSHEDDSLRYHTELDPNTLFF